MNRRSALVLLLLTFGPPCIPAWAQGNGNGNNGNGNNGNGNGNGNGNEGTGNNGNGKGGNGNGGNGSDSNGNANANAGGTQPDAGTTVTEPTVTGGELTDDEAVAAVGAGNAVSLEAILPDLRSRTGGEIIDAKLQQMQGVLLYVVTVLTPDGKVITEYYYARSGRHVER